MYTELENGIVIYYLKDLQESNLNNIEQDIFYNECDRDFELNPNKKQDGADKQMRDIWTIPLCQGKERLKDKDSKKALHPTQKPEELLKRIILGFSNENDVILDPFAGSGTTPYIAKKYNRNFIAIEKEEKYVKAIEKRVAMKYKKEKQITLDKEYITNCRIEQDYGVGLFGFNN